MADYVNDSSYKPIAKDGKFIGWADEGQIKEHGLELWVPPTNEDTPVTLTPEDYTKMENQNEGNAQQAGFNVESQGQNATGQATNGQSSQTQGQNVSGQNEVKNSSVNAKNANPNDVRKGSGNTK